MANVELQLLSNVIDRGDFQEVRRRGVTAQLFQTEEGRELFRWLHEEFLRPETATRSGGVVPSLDRVRRTFPEFDFCPSRDAIGALISELVDNNIAAGIREITEEMDEALDDGEDPSLILQAYMPSLRDLSISGSNSNQALMSQAAASLRAEYEAMAESGGITGIPYPWDVMNQATGGMQDEEWIVLYGRPKNMKCIAAGQRLMTRTGARVAIEDLPEECEAPSHTAATGKLRWAKARRVYSGEKDCVRVTTESGYTVETGDKHYFMVPEGSFEDSFERICDLEVGDWIATTRSLPDWEPTRTFEPALGWMLGALVGDGNYTRSEVQFSNYDREVVERMRKSVGRFECVMVRSKGGRPGEYRITAPGRAGNPLLDFLREEGMHGKKAENKEVPALIFESDKKTICAFLAGLLDTDGTVWPKKPYSLSWSTASSELAEGLKHLLARLGIVAVPYWSPTSGQGQWLVTVYGLEQHQKAAECLHPYIACTRKAQALQQLSRDRHTKRSMDGVPYSPGLMALIEREKGSKEWPKMSQSKFDRSKLFRRSGKISRALLMKLADAWDSEPLRIVAEQDILWDRIKEITPIGKRDCYDICIEDGQDPNFVVEGFAVHNTWIAIKLAVYAYVSANRRVLCYSKEMSKQQMIRRAASIIAGVDYEKLKTATLSDSDRELFFDIMDDMENWERAQASGGQQAAMSFISDRDLRGSKGATVDVLVAEAERFNADLMLVDGFYLMRDGRTGVRDRGWKTISNISSDLKDAAQHLGIPVIGTTQANRAAGKTSGDDTSEVAFADAIGQDCDLMARVFKGRNPATGKPKVMLTFPGVRDSVLNPFVINAWPGVDFGLLQRTVNVEAFLKDKVVSDEDDEQQAGGPSKSRRLGKKRKKRSDNKKHERL